jgi:hypothetical protein
VDGEAELDVGPACGFELGSGDVERAEETPN